MYICLVAYLLISYLMYVLVIQKLKVIRALWLDSVRILPIICMGEKNTVLINSQEEILRNVVLNKHLKLEVELDNKINFLKKLNIKQEIKINKG